jgi:hypothetical protein
MNENNYYQPPESNEKRKTPYNELDLQFMITEPAWGKEATTELNKKVSQVIGEAYYMCLDCEKPSNSKDKCSHCKGSNIQLVIDKEPLWGLLSYYTRDLRLGNLSTWNNEISFCHHWLSLAGDLLRAGHVKSFLSALSRVVDRIEISQSKQGFYRKRMGTVTSEQFSNKDLEPNKKNLVTNQNKNTR